MTASLKLWWQARTPRERRLLIALAAIAAPIFLWLAVLRPLDAARVSARERYEAAVTDLAQTEIYAAQIDRIGGNTAPAAPSAAVIERSATATGFAVRSFDHGSATIAIDAARPQALFAWLRQVERSGFAVSRFATRANPDRTLSAEIGFRPQRR